MEQIAAKLLIPFVVMLAVSALGIVVLALSARRRAPLAAAPAGAMAVARATRTLGADLSRSIVDDAEDPHDTLVIDRRALRDSMQGLPQFRSRGAAHDLRGPDDEPRVPSPRPQPRPADGMTPSRPRGNDPRAEGGAPARRPADRSSVDDPRAEGGAPARRPADRSSVDDLRSEGGPPARRPAAPDHNSTEDRRFPEDRRPPHDMFNPRPSPRGRAAEPADHATPTVPRKRGDLFDPPSRRPAADDSGERDMYNPPSRPRKTESRGSSIQDPFTPMRRVEPPRPTPPPDDAEPPPGPRRIDIFNPPSRPRKASEPPAGDMFNPRSRPTGPSEAEAATPTRGAGTDETLRARGQSAQSLRRPESGDIRLLADGRSGNLRGRDGSSDGERPAVERERGGRGGSLDGESDPRSSHDRDSLDDAAPRNATRSSQQLGAERRLQAVGVNIVLQQPLQPRAYSALPGRLEVIYGNFSPNDPREIPLLWPVGDRRTPCFVFSKSPGQGVEHIQLNHYTITPTVQADLVFENGRHTLGNRVDGEDLDRYQIRVNGVPMGLDERIQLHGGDIISMGIYRLKLIV